jgi:type III pantothenate kinase
MRVVGTGGLSALFAEWTPALEIVDDDLTLAGLRIIHKQNAG